MPLTIQEIRERQTLIGTTYRASKARKQEVYGRLMKELRIDPSSIDTLSGACEKIKNELSLQEKLAYIQAGNLAEGVRVRRADGSLQEGRITSIRPDGCLQVRLDNGKSFGWSPCNVVRLD